MAESFGDRLRRIRTEKRLHQTDLARITGFQPSAICHFELGRRSPSIDSLIKLADSLAVTTDYLLDRKTAPAAAGPAVERLFRSFEQMAAEDQNSLIEFAAILANKTTTNRLSTPNT